MIVHLKTLIKLTLARLGMDIHRGPRVHRPQWAWLEIEYRFPDDRRPLYAIECANGYRLGLSPTIDGARAIRDQFWPTHHPVIVEHWG